MVAVYPWIRSLADDVAALRLVKNVDVEKLSHACFRDIVKPGRARGALLCLASTLC